MAWVGAVMLFGIGLVMAACVLKIRRGTLRRNRWMGIRVPATFASESAWQAAHQRAAPWWGVCALLSVLLGIGFFVAAMQGVSDEGMVQWFVGSMLLVFLLIMTPIPSAIRVAKATRSGPAKRRS